MVNWNHGCGELPHYILKREASEWSHVHFGTHYDASKFFNEMKNIPFTGPHEYEIRFSNATYFKTKRIVEYINTSRPRPAYTPTSSSSQTDEKKLVSLNQSLQNKSQYALYDNGEGNSAKDQVQIDVAYDDRFVIICHYFCRDLTIGENGTGITEIENNLSTKFELNYI
ncbi:8889_t:CDS:2 [Funneliformis mosseae]|uniref:8889_t:CDS:1 n=1 Tax=Funneliformis mosseae TaxID=27381 RepID=A0A9N9B1X5_FUNMO|nr:8889_t:CDS:2 [Funneliformis mosseae]